MAKESFDFPKMIEMRAHRLGKFLKLRAPEHIIRKEVGLLFRAALAHKNEQKVGKSPSSDEGLAWLKEILDS